MEIPIRKNNNMSTIFIEPLAADVCKW